MIGFKQIEFFDHTPTRCSGLDVVRHDREDLHAQFSAHFRLIESSKELHHNALGNRSAIPLLLLPGRVNEGRLPGSYFLKSISRFSSSDQFRITLTCVATESVSLSLIMRKRSPLAETS